MLLRPIETGDADALRIGFSKLTPEEVRMRFLHPRGWTYFDTLRKKLHWNEGAVGP